MPYFSESVSTRERGEIVDITARVEAIVRKSAIKSGLCIVYVPHTTAAVSINENYDPDVKSDVLAKLEKMIPQQESYYQHGEGNSDSHLKTSLVGPSVTILVEDGKLVLGRWQGVYFCEFDGPRTREYFVKVIQG
jgi:secondary thiamine-phosphate synthase enzyme